MQHLPESEGCSFHRDSSSLRTSSSYTRRKWEDDLKKNSSINEGSTYHRR